MLYKHISRYELLATRRYLLTYNCIHIFLIWMYLFSARGAPLCLLSYCMWLVGVNIEIVATN